VEKIKPKGNTKPQENRGNGFTPEKIQQIKKAWLVHRCDSRVAKVLTVSKATIKKYRVAGGWDKLARKADEKTNKAIIKQTSKDTIDNLEMINEVKGWIYKTLKKFYEAEVFEPTVNDLDKMVRAGEFVQGNPDSRPDSSVTLNQVVHNLSSKSKEELLETVNNGERKYKTLGKETDNPVNRLGKYRVAGKNNA